MKIKYDPKEPLSYTTQETTYKIDGCPTCEEETTQIKTKDICCHVEVCKKCLYMSLRCDDDQEGTQYNRIDKAQLKELLTHKY